MKRIVPALLALAIAIPSIARADDASKQAKIQQLFTVMHVDQTQRQIIDVALREVGAAAQQQLHGAAATPEQKQKIQGLQQKVLDLFSTQIAWPKVEPEVIKLYSDAYTEEELGAILSFYKSPAGQAVLSKTPEITNKLVSLSRERLQQVQPQLRELLQDFARNINTSPSATPAPTAPVVPKGM